MFSRLPFLWARPLQFIWPPTPFSTTTTGDNLFSALTTLPQAPAATARDVDRDDSEDVLVINSLVSAAGTVLPDPACEVRAQILTNAVPPFSAAPNDIPDDVSPPSKPHPAGDSHANQEDFAYPSSTPGRRFTRRQRQRTGRLEEWQRGKADLERRLCVARTLSERMAVARKFGGATVAAAPPGERLTMIIVGDGLPTSIYDSELRKVIHRAALPEDASINDALLKAAELAQKCRPDNNPRGAYRVNTFSLHRGSTLYPRMSRTVEEYPYIYSQILAVLEPVRQHVEAIFRREFPALAAKYAKVMDRIAEDSELEGVGIGAAFYPFAAFSINHPSGSRGVVTRPHIDSANYAGGLCVVIPFGHFDHTRDCFLVVQELGLVFEVAAGQPIFFPSALYTHYNTELVSLGMRGSFVAWTGAQLFQYFELGCRAVSALSREELQMYPELVQRQLRTALEMRPRLAKWNGSKLYE
ncbi:hypothetical protein HMN09_00158100 [Mycena chlorophos]|uniref:Uncharacterized protein n=1 Tax=Mycena chlorophos TaxID=658473 RepID=A0A8H6TMY4_MYCCL|nr:hypothetical protein HMN09_00158100 [Mycena chlorophos]